MVHWWHATFDFERVGEEVKATTHLDPSMQKVTFRRPGKVHLQESVARSVSLIAPSKAELQQSVLDDSGVAFLVDFDPMQRHTDLEASANKAALKVEISSPHVNRFELGELLQRLQDFLMRNPVRKRPRYQPEVLEEDARSAELEGFEEVLVHGSRPVELQEVQA